MFTHIALAALLAAQSSSGVKWKPLTPPKPVEAKRPHAAIGALAQQPAPAPEATSDTVETGATTAAPSAAPQAFTTTPANAARSSSAATSSGPVLWRTIESGMTVAKLRSLFHGGPNVTYKADRTVLSDVPIIEGCEAKVNILHPAGTVSEIVMRGEGSLAGRCSLKIITALSGKYGQTLEKDKVRGSLFAREGKNYVWSRDGVTLQFKRYTSGPLGGGGLFQASWELRYSANAANIDL